jgi:two-component system NtrC family sensor kinase
MYTQSNFLGLTQSPKGREAQALLKHSEERFRTLVANIPGAVYRCICDGESQKSPLRTMAFLSEAIQEISGYCPSDFINNRVRSFVSIIHPQDRSRVEQAVSQSVRVKQPYVIEYRIVRADGRIAWVYDKGQGIFRENNENETQQRQVQPIEMDGVILDITERKQAEVELQSTQAFLNTVVENLPLGVFIKDAVDLRVMYWNKASEELFGYSREDVLGKNDYDFFPREQAKYLRAKDRQVLTGGQLVEIPEAPLNTPHRGERFMRTKKVPLLDEAGTPRYLLGISEDITDSKKAEEGLRESERHYRQILETASEGIWMFDVDSKTTFANSWIAEMLGYTVEEMLGRSLFDFMDENNQVLAQAYIERRRRGIHERHDFKFRRKDGSDLWAIVSATPILDARGQFVGVLRMITDITPRKQAEEALKSSHQEFVNIIERITDAFFALDHQWRFTYINSEAAQTFGRTWEELQGKNFWEVFPEAVGTIVEREYKKAIVQQIPVIFEIFHSYLNSWFEVRAYPCAEGLSIFWRDISERKQAEEALRQSESELRAKNQQLQQTLRQLKQTQAQLIQNEKMSSLGQMVAGIAHEINNPISFIYGNVAYARQYASGLLDLVQLYSKHYPEPVPEIKDEIEAIELDFVCADFPKLLASMKEGANRIQEIVLSLRNFSCLDEAERKAVDIHEGIDSTLLLLQHQLKKHSSNCEIQLRKEYGSLPLVECYPSQLNQVFMSLLSNAIDALETHSCPRFIAIRTEVKHEGEDIHPSHVVIRIADNGCGIPEKVKQRIFDPFFTTKPIGIGTGLGLSISHSIIVEKHEGQLTCISTPGEGTEFVIKLPIQQK